MRRCALSLPIPETLTALAALVTAVTGLVAVILGRRKD
jgi:hypothetical protein